jgi:CheY-like chemotaxis protein
MLKVLVVDDDQDILNIITLFLADNGYDFVTAMDGAEGISYNTPQKLDRGIRLMLACHIKKETEYGKEYSEDPRERF